MNFEAICFNWHLYHHEPSFFICRATAIKTGRYTHEKKTKDIEEVRKIIELKSKLVEQPAEDLENIVRKITAAHIHHLKQVVEKLSEKEKEYLVRNARFCVVNNDFVHQYNRKISVG